MTGNRWITGSIAVVAIAAVASGQYAIDWRTIDGGGGNCSGGGFEISGTIGQPDAGPDPTMTGGGFALTGGFWPISAVPQCACLADMNGDGTRNGADIQRFVQCLLLPGGSCACGDLDASGGVTVADIPAFVTKLLTQTACP